MTAIYLAEGSTLTPRAWCKELGIGDSSVDALCVAGLLRERQVGLLKLQFVGLVLFDNSSLIALPKFGGAAPFDLSGMVRILRGYFGRGRREPVRDELRQPEFGDTEVLREFDALVAIRKWFIEHGLYRREVPKRTTLGRPHWARTIARMTPLIAQGAVIYPEIEAERRHSVLNEISALQAGLLLRLCARYGISLPTNLHAVDHGGHRAVPSWPLPPSIKEHFVRRIALERRDQFQSENVRLLALLQELLCGRLASRDSKPQVFGTTAFYSVWEDACKVLFDGLERPASTIGSPQWTLSTAGSPEPPLQQLPDIAVKRGNSLFILDAKYYFPFSSSRPGAPDIIKQIYYAEAVAKPSWDRVLSVFVLPSNDASKPQFLGLANIQGSVRSFSQVEAWGMSPQTVFASYPNVSITSKAASAQLLDAVEKRQSQTAPIPPT